MHKVSLQRDGSSYIPTYESATAQEEVREVVSVGTHMESALDSETYHKELRIKSLKAYEWLNNASTPHELLISVLTHSVLERIMYTFLKWQTDEVWLQRGLSPIVLMASFDKSPVVKALTNLASLMTADTLSSGSAFVPWTDLMQGELGDNLSLSAQRQIQLTM